MISKEFTAWNYCHNSLKKAGNIVRGLHINPATVTELWVNDLLPEEQKNTIKYALGYRIEQKDLKFFAEKISPLPPARCLRWCCNPQQHQKKLTDAWRNTAPVSSYTHSKASYSDLL